LSTWGKRIAPGCRIGRRLLLIAGSCAYHPGPQAQQGTLQEGGDGSRPIEKFVSPCQGVMPSSSTLACATTIHAAVTAGVVSWSQPKPDRPFSVATFVGICRWMVERFGWQAPSR
jgi:hypothetical protein